MHRDKERIAESLMKKSTAAVISLMLILVTAVTYIAIGSSAGLCVNAYAASSRKPDVSADSYIVMSGSTSEVVLSKHSQRKLQPGNITMLMTAMVAIDNMYNEGEFENTVDIGDKLAKYDGAFQKGETVKVGDLLSAMLTGADKQAAEALASYSASKRSIFVNEMNSKAMALGIMDTQFDNPSGEYSDKQYSTAEDLAIITQAAFRYPKIKELLGQRSVRFTVQSKSGGRDLEFVSTNLLLAGGEGQSYKYGQGGISGSIGGSVNASQFAAVSVNDDMQIIAVLMDSEAGSTGTDARKLLEYGDANVTKNVIVKKDKLEGYVRIKGGAKTRAGAYTAAKGFAYVPPEGSEDLISTQVILYDNLTAPLSAGTKVGEFRIFVADELKGTVDLIIKKDVDEGWLPSKLYISNTATIVIAVILVLAAAFILRVRHVKKRRAKRREAMRRQKIRELARKQLEIDEDRRRRNWTGVGYSDMPPRTGDIRREAINEALWDGEKQNRPQK